MKVVKKPPSKIEKTPKKPASAGRVPLYRALSKLGKASREEAKALISAGKVKVHGAIEKNPDRLINPDRAHIEISGLKAVKDEPRVILFHKPAGYLTTKRDPEGRPTIYDLLAEEFLNFHAVGRLDLHTSGLLFLTNETKVSHFLTNPENQIPRTYIVQVRGEVSEEELSQMKNGIVDQGETLVFREVRALKRSRKESKLEVVLEEGKYREIRRVFAYFEHEVIKLKRIRFGEIELGDLPIAAVREVPLQEFKLHGLWTN